MRISRVKRGNRAEELNRALFSDDVLLVSEDVTLTHGWHEAIMRHYDKADIFGVSMLSPRGTVLDQGYDLVSYDDDLPVLRPYNRGGVPERFGFRECATVCGCFLYAKPHVLKKLAFTDGCGRWEEFLFTESAHQQGWKTGVVDHFCIHEGTTTKEGMDTSYLTECDLWKQVMGEWKTESDPRVMHIATTVTADLRKLLDSPHLTLYGAGSIADFLWRRYAQDGWRIVSGLESDWGREWRPGVKVEGPGVICETILNTTSKYLGAIPTVTVTESGNARELGVE